MEKVKTTRQELLKLRKNLVRVKAAKELLEQKRDTLVKEFLKLKGKFLEKKKELFEKTKKIITLAEFSLKFNSLSLLEFLASQSENKIEIKSSRFSIMGVRAKIFSLDKFETTKLIRKICPKSYFEGISEFEKILPQLIELSSLENILTKLALAIAKTRRRVNFLKEIIIPTMFQQIKYLTQRLSDQEREIFAFNLKFKKKKD